MRLLRFAAVLLFAVVLHVVLGWEWTLLAGVAAGWLFGRLGWLYGGLAVGSDWLLLVVFNYVANARAVGTMTNSVGSILGNMPSFAVVAITLFIGLLLGTVGGAAGTQLNRLVTLRRSPTTTP